MNILQTLQQLRDDIKSWVTVNLNALNTKIDEKNIPIDSELDSTSTNPVQNKVIVTEIADINNRVGNTPVATQISNALAEQPQFSGDYNDLINAPDITEDETGNMVIADENGNMIFKVDEEGIHTTALTLNGEKAATESYVDEAVANIDIPDVDLSNHYNKSETDMLLDNLKEELSESIESESAEWKIVDSDGNIILGVDDLGVHTTALTLNGENAVTESYVNNAISNIEFPDTDFTGYATEEYVDNAVNNIEFPEVDLTGYATETYIDNKVADLVDSAPEILNTIGEVAKALENHEDAYDALLETVGNKASKTDLENLKNEITESVTSESEEFHIVDNNGNVIVSIDDNGIATTTVTSQNIIVNGNDVEDHITDANIHVTTAEKEIWNNKSNFSGSYNDLTDKPKATDLSNYYTKTEVDTAIENVEVDLTGYATEEYVTNAIDNIDIPETDLTAYYTKAETESIIKSATEELSESIVSESSEWQVVDNNGNIIMAIDVNGVSTTTVTAKNININGIDIEELIQTRVKSYVDNAILGGEW